MKVDRILETCLYVEDLEAAEAFYDRVFGLEAFAKEAGRHIFFRCGDGLFLLFNPDATEKVIDPGITTHGARGSGHVAFQMAEADVDEWRRHLGELGVKIESDYRWPNGGISLYFRDPSGNSLELVTLRTWGMEE